VVTESANGAHCSLSRRCAASFSTAPAARWRCHRLPMASSVCRESTDPDAHAAHPACHAQRHEGNCCAASKRGSPRRQINWRSLDSNPSMLGPSDTCRCAGERNRRRADAERIHDVRGSGSTTRRVVAESSNWLKAKALQFLPRSMAARAPRRARADSWLR